MFKRRDFTLIFIILLAFFATYFILQWKLSVKRVVEDKQVINIAEVENQTQEGKPAVALSRSTAQDQAVSSKKSQTMRQISEVVPQSRRYPHPKIDTLKPIAFLADKYWLLWPHILAIPKNRWQGEADRLIAENSDFVMIVDEDASADLRKFEKDQRLVLYNERMHQMGVVTGSVGFRILDETGVEQILEDYHAVIVESLPHLKIFFVTADHTPFNLEKLYQSLKADLRLADVEIEILVGEYVKN